MTTPRQPRDGRTLPPTGTCHSCDVKVTGERKFCGPCAARRAAVNSPHPCVCECGWVGANERTPGRAAWKLARHTTNGCPLVDRPKAVPVPVDEDETTTLTGGRWVNVRGIRRWIAA